MRYKLKLSGASPGTNQIILPDEIANHLGPNIAVWQRGRQVPAVSFNMFHTSTSFDEVTLPDDILTRVVDATEDAELLIGNSNGDFYKSNNEGESWTQTYSGSDEIRCATVLNHNGIILAGTYNGTILRSTNNGDSFNVQATPVSGHRIYSLGNFGGGKVFAGTYYANGAKILYSDDYGLNWSTVYTSTQDGFWDIKKTDDTKLVASSQEDTGGGIYYSSNSGTSWTRVFSAPSSYRYVFKMANMGNGIVLAGGGNYTTNTAFIARSTDYGASWTSSLVGSGAAFWSVYNAGNGIAYAGQIPGVLYRTVDWGQNWTSVGQVDTTSSDGYTVAPFHRKKLFLRSGDPNKLYKSSGTNAIQGLQFISDGAPFEIEIGTGTSIPFEPKEANSAEVLDWRPAAGTYWYFPRSPFYAMKVKVNSTWKQVADMKVKIAGEWKEVTGVWHKQAGSWNKVGE